MSSSTMLSPESSLPPVMFFPPDALMSVVEEAFKQEVRPLSADALSRLGGIALKMIPDCNFRCKGKGYECYEYANDNWQSLPERMSDEMITVIGTRIGEYTKLHNIKEFEVAFHGGEPLFTKDAPGYYDHAIDLLEEAVAVVGSSTKLRYRMQTNASLLTERFLEVAKRRGIIIRCSNDGYEAAHNANRKTKQHGLGTFKMVDRGIRRVSDPDSDYRDQFGGILAVVDIHNDPIAIYESLCSYNAKEIDLLLPYANHDSPPSIPEGTTDQTPYASWLLKIFHRWWSDQEAGKTVPDIRLFRSIMNLSRGSASLTEAIGPYTSRMAFARTDGAYEGLDALNMISGDANTLGMNIYDHSLEQVADHLRQTHQLGKKELPQVCHDCKLVDICGGGHMETRYSSENDFDNASVFCEDLKVLIKEIVSVVNATFLAEIARSNLQAIRAEQGSIPAKYYPHYRPLIAPSDRSLAIRVRPAEPDDALKITELHGDAFYSNYNGVIPEDILQMYIANELLPFKYAYWQDQIDVANKTRNRVLIATMGKQMLGFAALNTTSDPDTMYLNAHYESPQVEGYGVGEALVSEIEHAIKDPVDIAVQSIKSTRQADFLRRRGFVPTRLSNLAKPAVIAGHALPPQPLIRYAGTPATHMKIAD